MRKNNQKTSSYMKLIHNRTKIVRLSRNQSTIFVRLWIIQKSYFVTMYIVIVVVVCFYIKKTTTTRQHYKTNQNL